MVSLVLYNSAKSGFEKLVDFNVSKSAEFAKSNEPILDEPITLEEIRKASTKLKTGKAAGNDSISNQACPSFGLYCKSFLISFEFRHISPVVVGGLYFIRL